MRNAKILPQKRERSFKLTKKRNKKTWKSPTFSSSQKKTLKRPKRRERSELCPSTILFVIRPRKDLPLLKEPQPRAQQRFSRRVDRQPIFAFVCLDIKKFREKHKLRRTHEPSLGQRWGGGADTERWHFCLLEKRNHIASNKRWKYEKTNSFEREGMGFVMNLLELRSLGTRDTQYADTQTHTL